MRAVPIAAMLAFALVGCGSSDESSGEPAATTGAEIVGSWERLTTCTERVAALRRAGLEEFAVSHVTGEGWIPGGQIKDPDHRPCRGAVPLEHGHFFTEQGEFGSTDAQGDQVDDGTFRVVDDDTIVIEKEFGEVVVDYRITNGSLFLDPVIPDCVETGCFAAQWAVSMAYPGLPWRPEE